MNDEQKSAKIASPPSWLKIEILSNTRAGEKYARLYSERNAPKDYLGTYMVCQKLDKPGSRWTDVSETYLESEDFVNSCVEPLSPRSAGNLILELLTDLRIGNLQSLLRNH